MNTGNMSNDEAKSIGDFIEQLNNIEQRLKKIQYNNDVFLDNQDFVIYPSSEKTPNYLDIIQHKIKEYENS